MSAILLTAPTLEPWTVAEAKSFLRIEHDDDDAIVGSLISAARNHVEAMTRRGLLQQSWRIVRDAWPADGRIQLRIGPLRGVTAARVYDSSGHASNIDSNLFVIDAAAGVVAAPCRALPMPGRDVAGIELDLDIGFGANAADVPPVLRHAIRTLVAHWYENRGLAAIGASVAMVPASVNAMIANYRVLSL